MNVIEARNVNMALYEGIAYLDEWGLKRDSRNGPVIVAPHPVTTVYHHPQERVILFKERDANPFFHLVEALWMLAGRDDLAALTPYAKNIANYSDDGGKTQPGAYGKRWRDWFKRKPSTEKRMDQVEWAIGRLAANPDDRRVVIQMYDAVHDQHAADNGGKDIPCNLCALPWVNDEGDLCLTVYNRSNDMVWGAYGANAVHFSVLQEWIAHRLGRKIGPYYQVSNNFHMYEATAHQARVEPLPYDPYINGDIVPMAMFEGINSLEELDDDLSMFFADPARVGIRSPFLRRVACPMVMAHRAYKKASGYDRITAAQEILEQMPNRSDWLAGATVWLSNREEKLLRQKDDGVSYD